MGFVIHRGFHDDLAAGNVTGSADLRIILVMSNTTCDTETGAQTMSDFTTIDECDGAGYAELDLAGVTSAWDASGWRW